jgi:hypothetical protein
MYPLQGSLNMKKSILAIAIPALFATNLVMAGGINLVKTDDLTVNFNGDLDLKIYNNDDKKHTQIETNFDDFDFTFTYGIDDNLQFIAETDFTMEFQEDEPLKNAAAWIGVKNQYGLLRAGFQETSFDPLGIDNSELTSVGMASGDTDGRDGSMHESSIVYEYKADSLWISATYGKEEYSDSDDIQPEMLQFAAMANVGQWELGFGVGKTTTPDSTGEVADDSTYYQGQAEYNFGNATLGILHGYQDEKIDDVQTQGTELDFTYKVTDKFKVVGGYERISQDISGVTGNDDLDYSYLGINYSFSKLVTLYTEVGKKKGDYAAYGKNTTTRYDQNVVGLMLGVDF